MDAPDNDDCYEMFEISMLMTKNKVI